LFFLGCSYVLLFSRLCYLLSCVCLNFFKRLHSYPDNYRVWKTLIVAQYNNVSVELPDFTMNVDNKKPEFLAKFPNGEVPALETPEGPLSESGAIMKYVARLGTDVGLFGGEPYETGLVEQWIDWAAFELETARGAWLLSVKGFIEPNPPLIAEARKDIAKCMDLLDAHFLRNTFLVGHRITLADIVVGTAFVDLLRSVMRLIYLCLSVSLSLFSSSLPSRLSHSLSSSLASRPFSPFLCLSLSLSLVLSLSLRLSLSLSSFLSLSLSLSRRLSLSAVSFSSSLSVCISL